MSLNLTANVKASASPYVEFKALFNTIKDQPNLSFLFFKKPSSEIRLSDYRQLRKFINEIKNHSITLLDLINLIAHKYTPPQKYFTDFSFSKPSKNTSIQDRRKVMIVAAEFLDAKRGGLHEVVTYLAPALRKLGLDVIVVTPEHAQIGDSTASNKNYRTYGLPHEIIANARLLEKHNDYKRKSWYSNLHFATKFGGISINGTYAKTGSKKLSEAQYWSYRGDTFSASNSVYAGGHADPYRYMEFNLGVALLASSLNIDKKSRHRIDLIHGHDWHTGWIPTAMHIWRVGMPQLNIPEIPFAFTVHNAGLSDGIKPNDFRGMLGLHEGEFSYLYDPTNPLGVFNKDQMDPFVSGLKMAEISNVVSENYRTELLNNWVPNDYSPIFNFIHAQERLEAITNGASPEYSPQNWDKNIADGLKWDGNQHTFLDWKSKTKEFVQNYFGLKNDPNAMLISMIGRVTAQKGHDLAVDLLHARLEKGENIQVLLTIPNEGAYGDPRIIGRMRELEKKYPKNVRLVIFAEREAKLMYGAADLLLMPSEYEPCGLVQINGFQCGALTLGRKTGGLVNTINHLENGYLFDAYWPQYGNQYSYDYFMKEFHLGFQTMYDMFQNKMMWNSRVMKTLLHSENFSWNVIARLYDINVYDNTMRRQRNRKIS